MVFRRRGSAKFSFQARTETGRRQLPTGTTNRVLAQKIAAMWEQLAEGERAFDLLNRVLDGTLKVTRLFDLWQETRGSVPAIRRLLEDVDLEPFVTPWERLYQAQRPKSLRKNLQRLRWLVPAGQVLPRSTVTTAWLTERLYAYPGKPGTRRGVHSAWSVFFAYLTDVHGLFEVNPMARVKRPPPAPQTIRFFEIEQVEQIVRAQMTPELQAFFAIAYGTGIETGVTLNLTRGDFHPVDHEIRAAGTKTHTRDRMARVTDWAWNVVWGYAVHLPFSSSRLFPLSWRDDQVSRWHAETLKQLKLPHYPLHNARHHWAVTHLRGGMPLEAVRRQLGHSTPTLTLKTYGQFLPSGEDRAKWEAMVAADLERRRAVK